MAVYLGRTIFKLIKAWRNIPDMRIFLLFIFFASSVLGQDTGFESLEEDGRKVINLGRQKHFQGDVILTQTKHRNAILSPARWPNGIIPYTFGTKYPKKYHEMVIKAMKTIEKNTCVQFQERTNEKNFVTIVNGTGGCYSEGVGRKGGEQLVSLMLGWKTTCFTHAIVLHELLHAVGLWHEQMRYDRDNHITIHWDNVHEDAIGQFRIIPQSQSSIYDLPYDYKSVMHYDATAFSKSKGLVTMEPTDKNYLKVIGKAKDASANDWEKVRKVYNCKPPASTNLERSSDDFDTPAPPPCADRVGTCKLHAKQCDYANIRYYCKKTCNLC